MVSDYVDLTASAGDAERVVLHARTATDVSQDEDLGSCFWWRGAILRGGFVFCGGVLGAMLRWEHTDEEGHRSGDVERDADDGFDHGGTDLKIEFLSIKQSYKVIAMTGC